MSLLNSKFDILRGYPNGSALTWPFPIKTAGSPPVPVALPGGTIVTQELQAGQTVVDKATSPNITSANPKEPWLVVEGNDDFSGQFVGKCACAKLGSGIIFETDQYDTGTYTPGVPVTMNAGKIASRATPDATKQIIGFVLEDRTATKGTVVVSA
jgi:hypothetical protein